mgnify:CR=1 FL=1
MNHIFKKYTLVIIVALMSFNCSSNKPNPIKKSNKAIVSLNTGLTILKVRTAISKGNSFIVANSYEGTLLGVSNSGKILWKNALSGFMNHDVWVRDLDNDGSDEILTANADGSTVNETYCLPDGCYDFVITDAYGDGICCSYGNGSYTVTSGSSTLASGGSFTSSDATNFCLGGGPAPTCSDGVQNGNETGVDCGGPDCAPCVVPPTCDDGIQNGDETGVDCGGSSCAPCSTGGNDVLHEGYFESGWDGWSDGGSDCYRYSGSRSYEGSRSIRLRDNSGTASSMTSETFNLSSYNEVEVSFYFYPNSMESGEDFWLRYNDGSGWQTIETYTSGVNFNNDNFSCANRR